MGIVKKLTDPKVVEREINHVMVDYVEDGKTEIYPIDDLNNNRKNYIIMTSWKYVDNTVKVNNLQTEIEKILEEYGLKRQKTESLIDCDRHVHKEKYTGSNIRLFSDIMDSKSEPEEKFDLREEPPLSLSANEENRSKRTRREETLGVTSGGDEKTKGEWSIPWKSLFVTVICSILVTVIRTWAWPYTMHHFFREEAQQ
jgi:hypothetical protein